MRVRLLWHHHHVDHPPFQSSDASGPAATAMALQLAAHPALSARLASFWERVVMWERIARGSGATRWYLARTRDDARHIFGLLGPGSRVTFCFAGPLRVDPLSERVIGAMFEAVGEAGEIVIGTPEVGTPVRLDAELVSGPSELAEYLMQPQPSGDLVWGPLPGLTQPDSVTVVLVDRDGIVRSHPH
jgi:hypothetical protein